MGDAKRCGKCEETKPLEEFTRTPRTKDGRGVWCKDCHGVYRRENSERYRERQHAYYLEHREELKAKSQANRAKDPEAARIYSRVRNRDWRERNRDQLRRARLKRHGLTVEEYDEILEAQGGGCAICGSTEPGGRGDFHIDHDHDTGLNRGLLCHRCNTGLGLFADDPAGLRAAAAYIERYQRRGTLHVAE